MSLGSPRSFFSMLKINLIMGTCRRDRTSTLRLLCETPVCALRSMHALSSKRARRQRVLSYWQFAYLLEEVGEVELVPQASGGLEL
jgi:hypothetical protein